MNNLITLEVTGNAMVPTISEGAVINVDMGQTPRANGKDIGVFNVNDHLHVARYTRYGSQLILIHENAAHAVVPAAYVEILGKVVQNEENHSAENTMAFGNKSNIKNIS